MKTVLYFRLQWRLCQRYADGVYRYARQVGWRVQLIDAMSNAPSARQAIDWWGADGCIVDWLFMDRMGWTPDVFGGLPTVFIDAIRTAPYDVCHGVDHDAVDCVRLAADELLALGYQDYAYVGTIADLDWSVQRGAALERRMAAAGKRYHVFHPASAPVSAKEVDLFYRELGPWVASLPRPCGIFAANDKVASRVLNACELEGIKVPESIAVVGVDDDEMICENAVPTLSSVRPDFEGGGFLAAELLDKVMKRPNRRPERLKYGSKKIVRRNSTRIFKRHDAAVRDAVEWVRLNACSGIAPADVIARIGGSRRSAEVRFRDFSGRSIGEEITAVRLERAKELLSKPLVPIDSIYVECGYADPTSLRKAFRKAFNQSPREWRLAHLA